MRIVGGELSGRTFAGPGGDKTRPTAERVREAVFSALEARGLLEGTRVLDLYAGTGALAFEALSRGAASALSVECDARNAKAIERDAQRLGLRSHATQVLDLSRPKALSRLGTAPFDLVFADPPWADLKDAAAFLAPFITSPLFAPAGHLVLVHAARDRHPALDPLAILADYRYGDTAVVLYAPPSPKTDEEPTEEEASAT